LRGVLILASMSVMVDPSAYRERRSAVGGVTVWTRVADGSSSWILPDGCIDALWNGRELTVAGPDTTTHRASPPNGTVYTALRFDAGVAPAVLGLAADGLRDQRGMSLVRAALAAGYADQPHFAHEVRALTGLSASQLVGSGANRSTPLPSGSRSVA
jgi:AraC-like DNA-binding protein